MGKVVNKLVKSYSRSGAVTAKAALATGQSYFIHSSYDPEQEARDWVTSLTITPYTAYLVLGLGLGYHVRALLNRLPDDCRVYVIEPSQEECMLNYATSLFPQKKWLKDPRVVFMVGPSVHALGSDIANRMRKEKIKKVTVCPFFPVMQLYPAFYDEINSSLVERANEIFSMNFNFECKLAATFVENSWRNLPRICRSPGVRGFKDKFRGIPAIIVSAGPSLNKNIDQLKAYADKAFIIASGSAIGALAKHGIKPHMLAVLDAAEIMYDVLKEDLNPEVALLGIPQIHPKIVAEHHGQAVFGRHHSVNVFGELTPLLPESEIIESSVSVATAAFNFCTYAGADPIIFMGQDLAYAADASHADGVRTSANLGHAFRELKGMTGETLKTSHALFQVWQYLVVKIARLHNRTVINATEGGAYLDGAVHLTFRQAAAEHLTRQHDIEGMLAEVAGQFTFPQKERVQQKIGRLLKDIADLRTRTEKEFGVEPQKEQYDVDMLRVEVAKMRRYLDGVRKGPVYQYIKPYAETLFEVHAHALQTDLPIEQEYQEKVVLKDAIYEFLGVFAAWVAAAYQELAAQEDAQKGGKA